MVLMGLTAQMVLKVHRVSKERLAHKVFKARLGRRVKPVHRAYKAKQEQLAQRVTREIRVILV
jgi:hypothetical protein